MFALAFTSSLPLPLSLKHPFPISSQPSRPYQGPTASIYRPPPKPTPTLSPVLILPGLGNAASDYTALATHLASQGHIAVAVAPIQRWQWSLNVKGMLTRDYWQGTLQPQQVLDWYINEVDKALSDIASCIPSCMPVNVVGHSAGGWLARYYISQRAQDRVPFGSLITLGTPNQSPPQGGVDQTRGLLRYVENECDVRSMVEDFVCVAGKGTIGRPIGKGSVGENVAYLSYLAVGGKGEVDGDGVTPVHMACASGGRLVTCECGHSMLTGSRWYGHEDVAGVWRRFLV